MLTPLQFAHEQLREIITPRDLVVDATMGNGHDTLFLAELSQHVIAFDVQEAAIVATQARLAKAGLSARLIHDGHEHLDKYVAGAQIKAAIFNLGYLPNSDKQIITQASTTLVALQKILDRLADGGRIAIMVYHGHEGGGIERDALLDFVGQLPQTTYQVMRYGSLNQINQPPFLIVIERQG